jgi:hypothetical protein
MARTIGPLTATSASWKVMSVVRVFRTSRAVLQRRLWFDFCLSLGGHGLMLQPAFLDCLLLDLLSLLQDFRTAPDVAPNFYPA